MVSRKCKGAMLVRPTLPARSNHCEFRADQRDLGVAIFTAKEFPIALTSIDCRMTEPMLYTAPRGIASAEPDACEISSFSEADRALRMMDRELALLRQEHQELIEKYARLRLSAVAGAVLGGCGSALALITLLAG
jgi:hypothetical protein